MVLETLAIKGFRAELVSPCLNEPPATTPAHTSQWVLNVFLGDYYLLQTKLYFSLEVEFRTVLYTGILLFHLETSFLSLGFTHGHLPAS